jgi:hypothetical protein
MRKSLPIAHPWIDSSRAPVYQVTFPVRDADNQLLSYFRACELWATTADYPVAWVMDMSRLEEITAKQRALFAEYMTRLAAYDRLYNRGTGIVIPNSFVRGCVTAVFWLKPPAFPVRFFEKQDLALDWAQQRLRESA